MARARAEAIEDAAKVVEAEEARMMAYQKPTNDPLSFDDAVNANIRMTTVLLPDIAAAIRSLKDTQAPGGGK